MVLSSFSAPVREWFTSVFAEPTPAQVEGWSAIGRGGHTLIFAPTGSGKTLAAFLWGLDQLTTAEAEPDEPGTRLLYISPLRALAVDIDKNLRAPLQGIRVAAERSGVRHREPTVGLRTGDTSPDERRQLVRKPPDVLITTPESLYLMLTSQARETLRSVETVIVDEIHSVAAAKRGAHLAVSLERLEELTARSPQRIGLSATQRPLDEIARFLGGYERPEAGTSRRPRPVEIVDVGARKELDVRVVVPVEDMGRLGEVIEEPTTGPGAGAPERRSIWPAIYPRLLEAIEAHRSTLVFVNSRRLAERVATRLNELALESQEEAGSNGDAGVARGSDLVKAHHGSLSRERRLQIEDELKQGRLKGLVATSSLELGIDMGAVDLVIQIESPGAVARGLQRIGRAGHQVGVPSRGRLFPKHRGDLLEAATVVQRMREGLIEQTRYPRNPLDVLAQQIVAMVALEDWPVDRLAEVLRRAASFAELSDDVLDSVLDLLAGRYPSEEFSELRPRIVWDRVSGVIRARAGAQRLAVTSGGTIPDRGLFGVFLPDGTRVGELDEEMVYESRPGETFLLGASTWRIEDITFERVVVTPAPGEPGRMPFWHGDGPGRPLELGRAVGALVRELRAGPSDAVDRLQDQHGLDAWAAQNLLAYLDEQAEATGAVPDDRTIVVERFRDEIGDWRVCVLSPLGARVHAPWAIALKAKLEERWGADVEVLWSDDGIVVRLPEVVDELPLDELAIDPDEIDEVVIAQLPRTAMYASRFRECAGRALLLPRRRPDQRTPLWQQRQRSADLLAVAARYPSFPILLETTRECVNDVFDVPALRRVLADLAARKIRVIGVETPRASPFARSLLFDWIAVYMYEGDAPVAERRAAALSLDRELLRDLLGTEELRDLLAPEVLAAVEAELQRLVERRAARDLDEVHDLLRLLGPLAVEELEARCVAPVEVRRWLDALVGQRRVFQVRIASEDRFAAAEDAGRLRDGLGAALPVGLPAVFTEPTERPLDDLVLRYARSHGPFTVSEVADRYGLPPAAIEPVLDRLARDGSVMSGAFRPGGTDSEWCDDDVLRQLRRRSLAALRREIEPVDAVALARFLPRWQGVGAGRGPDALVDALTVLQGAPLVASALEASMLPARVDGYRPADLDALCTSGDVVWMGDSAIGSADGRIRLAFRDQASLLFGAFDDDLQREPIHEALLEHLSDAGASFWSDLVAAVAEGGLPYDDQTVLAALWDLVWAGLVTNDTLAPVRALVSHRQGRRSAAGRSRRPGRRLATMRSSGPPSASGRWSLVAPLLLPSPAPTEVAHAQAAQLLERHGVLTREAAVAEGTSGGFAGVYPMLKALEERGDVRRGYFVAGLGAAQFALPGAVDRLRDAREPARPTSGEQERADAVMVLAATDPAQPYGAALRWPESSGRPARAAGALVILVDGEPAVYVESGGRSIVTFETGRTDDRWVDALVAHLGGRGRVEVQRVDGERPDPQNPAVQLLLDAGFTTSYKGLSYRPPVASSSSVDRR